MSAALFDYMELCQRLLDDHRIEPYARVLHDVVTSGAVVVDIGTGLGIFALLACRYGARRVYAIDSGPVLELARQVAAANGCTDRIEFILGDSRQAVLPERADVVVADVRRILPEFQVSVMIDARRRLLKPGGALVPRTDRLWAAIVESPARYEELVGIWRHHPQGFAADVACRRSAQTWVAQRFQPDELVSEPACWATIDYRSRESSDIVGTLDTTVGRRATGHGLCVWFESELARGVAFTSRPEGLAHDYGAAFFPWPDAVDLDEGDRVVVSFDATLAPGGYRWRWHTTLSTGSGTVKACFEQDTARLTERDALAGSDPPHHLPSRDNLSIDRYALAAMDEGMAVGAIAEQLLARFPGAFGDRRAALTRAGALSARYG